MNLAQVAPEAPSPVSRMGLRILARRQEHGPYSVRLARTPEDVRAAQTLRFLVFNIEMQEGLESSYLTCRDEDPFDPVCDHLLVEQGGEVVGTYRMQTGQSAALHSGYYGAQEFDFAPFEPVRDALVELGRACVAREHRNLVVLSLLWRGIANYARRHACRYLVGCSSLTSQDPVQGATLFRQLAANHLAPATFQTCPRAGWECALESAAGKPPKVPKLLSAYLSMGAKICSPPALDRDFRTIDFLTLLDLQALPPGAEALLS